MSARVSIRFRAHCLPRKQNKNKKKHWIEWKWYWIREANWVHDSIDIPKLQCQTKYTNYCYQINIYIYIDIYILHIIYYTYSKNVLNATKWHYFWNYHISYCIQYPFWVKLSMKLWLTEMQTCTREQIGQIWTSAATLSLSLSLFLSLFLSLDYHQYDMETSHQRRT